MGATIGCRHGTIDAIGTAAAIAGTPASTTATIAASTNSRIEH